MVDDVEWLRLGVKVTDTHDGTQWIISGVNELVHLRPVAEKLTGRIQELSRQYTRAKAIERLEIIQPPIPEWFRIGQRVELLSSPGDFDATTRRVVKSKKGPHKGDRGHLLRVDPFSGIAVVQFESDVLRTGPKHIVPIEGVVDNPTQKKPKWVRVGARIRSIYTKKPYEIEEINESLGFYLLQELRWCSRDDGSRYLRPNPFGKPHRMNFEAISGYEPVKEEPCRPTSPQPPRSFLRRLGGWLTDWTFRSLSP